MVDGINVVNSPASTETAATKLSDELMSFPTSAAIVFDMITAGPPFAPPMTRDAAVTVVPDNARFEPRLTSEWAKRERRATLSTKNTEKGVVGMVTDKITFLVMSVVAKSVALTDTEEETEEATCTVALSAQSKVNQSEANCFKFAIMRLPAMLPAFRIVYDAIRRIKTTALEN